MCFLQELITLCLRPQLLAGLARALEVAMLLSFRLGLCFCTMLLLCVCVCACVWSCRGWQGRRHGAAEDWEPNGRENRRGFQAPSSDPSALLGACRQPHCPHKPLSALRCVRAQLSRCMCSPHVVGDASKSCMWTPLRDLVLTWMPCLCMCMCTCLSVCLQPSPVDPTKVMRNVILP